MIREPLKHVRDIEAEGARITRKGHDSYRVQPDSDEVLITYQLLCPDLTVRTNHMDSSHLHLVPTFTWMMPTRGWEGGSDCTVSLKMPDEWSAATQLHSHPATAPSHASWEGGNIQTWSPPSVDELYDSVIEADADPDSTREICGVRHHLRIHDVGGRPVPLQAVERIQDAMEALVKEFVALFGPLPYDDYWTILLLTGGARGGLDHLRSQTSMVPRKAIWPDQEEAWRDLVSLLSHEYAHVWNVKRLRPRAFLDYDLSQEVHTDLLWWFEGGTSWLGDIICVKSGVWSEEDWRKDMTRKLRRFNSGTGNDHQSLATSSHEAWIHLYRPHAYSRESTISYYLEGEMAMLCIDAEIRRRSKGQNGLESVFADLMSRHGLESREIERPGVSYQDIRRALTRTPGGARLGGILDSLTKDKMRPDVAGALRNLGIELESEEKGEKAQGWLGVTTSTAMVVKSLAPASPVRNVLIPGDEIISIDGIRVSDSKSLKEVLKGRISTDVDLSYARHGIMASAEVEVAASPDAQVLLKGEGNRLWQAMLASNQAS